MAIVTKLKSGFIYQSDFSSSLGDQWEASPNVPSRYYTDGTRLHLEGGGTPLYLFFNQLTEEKRFVMDVKNTYNPTQAGEIGGIVIYSDANNFIALEEYFDVDKGIANTYPWLRLVRDYNVYTGYWSKDGKTWQLVGTQNFGEVSPKIGLFVDGSTEHLLVDYVRIFRSVNVYIENPPAGTKLKLLDEDGNEVTEKTNSAHYPTAFDLSLLGIPVTGKFKWEGNSILQDESNRELWGGDEFRFQLSLDLYYTDKDGVYKRVDANEEEFLGYLNSVAGSGTTEFRDIAMTVKNPHSAIFNSVSIEPSMHKDTDHYNQFVSVSVDGSNFSNIAALGSIPALGEKSFYLRVRRATELESAVPEFYFGLNIVSGSVG
ncbi:hypothetical protein SAMN05446037_100666 [Anaerovirgula multivorans]|uniref:Beta-xylosidase C-terminal Concanavalin A-like domain-containing protein n=1 Tax=Anaerovirgula multivorans TaxID=312168 RepID=A0A239CNY3_9FIRM|nr:hypothetical protein [Anaerovirgula multivorans]SNS21649.1 hypothetical protein SAMN05446037_100666 [Anaerovirgula multivorans]